MQQDVYADLYFLINMGMDLLSLMITASLLHRQVKRYRAILAAAIGGAYAVAALLFGAGGILALLADGALCFVLVTVSFASRRTGIGTLFKCAAVQLLTSAVLGGVMTGLYTLLNRLDLPLEALQGEGLSVWMFLLLSIAAAFATARGGRLFGLSRATRNVTVRARLFGKEITLSALVDSGNLLRDPVSGRSVIVADRHRIFELLPAPLARDLASSDIARWLGSTTYAKYLRPIPTHTAAGEVLLPALIPESLEIRDGKSTYAADYLIAPAELGKNAVGFDAVIPAE